MASWVGRNDGFTGWGERFRTLMQLCAVVELRIVDFGGCDPDLLSAG